MSLVFKAGLVHCKLIFKDFLIVSGKRNVPLKGDSSRDGCCRHTHLSITAQGAWRMDSVQFLHFLLYTKEADAHPGYLRAPRHLHGAGRSDTGPRINLSPCREASRGEVAYPGCLREHNLPTFGQLNLAREAAL